MSSYPSRERLSFRFSTESNGVRTYHTCDFSDSTECGTTNTAASWVKLTAESAADRLSGYVSMERDSTQTSPDEAHADNQEIRVLPLTVEFLDKDGQVCIFTTGIVRQQAKLEIEGKIDIIQEGKVTNIHIQRYHGGRPSADSKKWIINFLEGRSVNFRIEALPSHELALHLTGKTTKEVLERIWRNKQWWAESESSSVNDWAEWAGSSGKPWLATAFRDMLTRVFAECLSGEYNNATNVMKQKSD